MIPPMTDDLVGRLQKLLAEAIPLPWKLTPQKGSIRGVFHRQAGNGEVQRLETRIVFSGDGSTAQRDANFELIVEAVNALPTLLARIEALEGENRKLREVAEMVVNSSDLAGFLGPLADTARAALAKDKSDG